MGLVEVESGRDVGSKKQCFPNRVIFLGRAEVFGQKKAAVMYARGCLIGNKNFGNKKNGNKMF